MYTNYLERKVYDTMTREKSLNIQVNKQARELAIKPFVANTRTKEIPFLICKLDADRIGVLNVGGNALTAFPRDYVSLKEMKRREVAILEAFKDFPQGKYLFDIDSLEKIANVLPEFSYVEHWWENCPSVESALLIFKHEFPVLCGYNGFFVIAQRLRAMLFGMEVTYPYINLGEESITPVGLGIIVNSALRMFGDNLAVRHIPEVVKGLTEHFAQLRNVPSTAGLRMGSFIRNIVDADSAYTDNLWFREEEDTQPLLIPSTTSADNGSGFQISKFHKEVPVLPTPQDAASLGYSPPDYWNYMSKIYLAEGWITLESFLAASITTRENFGRLLIIPEEPTQWPLHGSLTWNNGNLYLRSFESFAPHELYKQFPKLRELGIDIIQVTPNPGMIPYVYSKKEVEDALSCNVQKLSTD